MLKNAVQLILLKSSIVVENKCQSLNLTERPIFVTLSNQILIKIKYSNKFNDLRCKKNLQLK